MEMKTPRMMRPIDMNRGENKEIDQYNNYTLKINIQWIMFIQNIWLLFILSVI